MEKHNFVLIEYHYHSGFFLNLLPVKLTPTDFIIHLFLPYQF